MKYSKLLFFCASGLLFSNVCTGKSIKPYTVCSPKDIEVNGYLGKRLNECFQNNLKTTDGLYLTAPFKSRKETRTWQTEFWGKWMHAAVPMYIYTEDTEFKANIDASVKDLLSTQRADGYIGNYTDAAQLNGPWDIWGRKYTMLGLLYYYDLTGDETVLKAACRVADHLMTQVGKDRKDIYKVGNYHGMASCSVLEPILWLYKRTDKKDYLDFAGYIASQLEDPEDSAKLISKALNNVDVGSRFPHPKRWWSWENGHKAYEMMSCYQGLLEYYMATGKEQYLNAAAATARNIIATEINAAGSGAAFECWYHGREQQTTPAFHMMETCVTITWMRLCETLLRLTGDRIYADCLEQSLFNAFPASLAQDGSTFSKYCPLEGRRGKGANQCRMKTNCCIANGPRGFIAMMESILMAHDRTILLNLYHDCKAAVRIPATSNKVTIAQNTEYPVDGLIDITVHPQKPEDFTLKLRIPAWSRENSLTVNGQKVHPVTPGSYVAVNRLWKAGDKIRLTLDMSCRKETMKNHFVLKRGPVTLVRDSRFNDGNIHEVTVIPDTKKPLKLTKATPEDKSIWMTFTTDLKTGINLESKNARKPKKVHFCDFASAGNTWDDESLYRVWQRTAINVMHQPYVSYNPDDDE
ncbi:MAG: glycoside hydrolase family 127 protein [Kiritimatiellia bacterium]